MQWGYYGENTNATNNPVKVPFFKQITIYGLSRHKFTSYTLINPIITRFSHDTYNYAEGNGTLEMQMEFAYESVAYNTGSVDGTSPSATIPGFGNPGQYDLNTSSITTAGMNSLVPGQAGYIQGGGTDSSPTNPPANTYPTFGAGTAY